MFVLADTHVFNSNLVNIARFGYMRFDGTSTIQNPITAQAIGKDADGRCGTDVECPGTDGRQGSRSAMRVPHRSGR